MATHVLDTEYLDATSEAALTLRGHWRASGTFTASARATLFLGAGMTETEPYPLLGNGGTIDLDDDATKYFTITAPYAGSLNMQLANDEDRTFTWVAYDEDGDEIGSGTNELVLALDEQDYALIRLTQEA